MTSNILVHLRELQTEFRNQDFKFSKEQQERYDILLQARRDQVKSFYAEGRVSKGRKADESDS